MLVSFLSQMGLNLKSKFMPGIFAEISALPRGGAIIPGSLRLKFAASNIHHTQNFQPKTLKEASHGKI
jgi:hypothetical protein